jgi:hypothetical protein
MLLFELVSILLTWVVAAILLAGVGSLVLDLIGGEWTAGEAFWVGFAASLGFLEAWHLALPVNFWPSIILAVGGIAGLAVNRRRVRNWIADIAGQGKLVSTVFCLFALYAAWRAAGRCEHFDTALYGAATVAWDRAYAVVPGLANLHGRFGFNSASHLFLAMLEHGYWAGETQHLYDSGMSVALMAWALPAGVRIVRDGGGPVVDWFVAVFALPAAVWAIYFYTAVGMDTDVPAQAACMAGMILLYRRLTGNAGTTQTAAAAMVLTGAVLLKLATAAFAGPAWLIAAWLLWTGGGRRALGAVTVLSAVMVALWMTHGIILSGYPLYPSTAFGFPVDWLARRSALFDAAGVTTWARGTDLNNTHGMGWLVPWIKGFVHSRVYFFLPGVVIAGAVAGLVLNLLRHWKAPAGIRRGWIVLVASAASLAVCMVKAPDPRFFAAAMWSIPAIVAATVMGGRRGLPPWGVRAYVAAALLVAFWVVEPKRLYRDLRDRHPSLDWALPTPPIAERSTTSGLTVFVPIEKDVMWRNSTWNTPLVTTPYFDPGLKERVPGDPRHGFLTTTPPVGETGFRVDEEGHLIQ